MNASTRYQTPRQRSMLILVLLGILLLSMAAAWWFTLARGDDVRRGEDIIGRIREKSLEHYWANAPHVLWYLGRSSSGRVVAVRRISRVPVAKDGADGITEGYEGADTLYRLHGLRWSWEDEAWWISTDAARGSYNGPTRDPMFIRTRIHLDDGRIRVEQVGPRTLAAETTAPVNYIPEGLTLLAVRLVASEGKEASFRTIINSQAIVKGRVSFAEVTMTPGEGGKVLVVTTTLKGQGAAVYSVDEAGRITRIAEGGARGLDYRPVPEEEVRKHFPSFFEGEEPDGEDDETDAPEEVEIPVTRAGAGTPAEGCGAT